MTNRIKVQSEVRVYRIDYDEQHGLNQPVIVVKAHSIDSRRVLISLGGHDYEVIASDMFAAIKNAQNAS